MGDSSDDFEPFDHRTIAVPITRRAALIHFLKGAIGTGILAMPNVFISSGMWLGIFTMMFFGFVVTYTIHLLFDCQYRVCKIKKIGWMTYGEAFEAALSEGPAAFKVFTKYGQTIILTMFIIYQLGIMTTYVQFVAENIRAIVENWISGLNLEEWMILIMPAFLGMMMVKNLKYLTPFSTAANVISIGTFGIVLYYVVQDLPSFTSRPAITENFSTYPIFFGTAFFALHSLGVVISLEQSLKNPRDFRKWNGVLNTAMLIISLFYLIFAVLGYWKYGKEAKDSITLNFPKNDILAMVCKGLYAVAILISYGLQGFVPVNMMWSEVMEKKLGYLDTSLHWQYFLRISVVMITYFCAVAIPCLGSCISITGAFALSILGVIFPVIMDFCLSYKKVEAKWIIRDILLLILGLAGLFLGCLVAILDMIKCVRKE